MRHSVLALILIVASSAGAQQPTTIITGFPIVPRIPAPHTPTPLPVPISRLRPRSLPAIRQPSRVTLMPSYLYTPYMQPYMQQVPSVTVNVNNYEQPQPVYVVPTVPFTGTSFGLGTTLAPRGASAATESRPPALLTAPKSRRVAEPSDVNSLDAVVHAMYELVSGPSIKGRDWDRYRSLFVEEAHISTTVNAPGSPADVNILTADDYIAKVAPEFQRGVFEKEVSRKVELSGRMAHVFSTFETRHNVGDEKPFRRGVHSIQLLNDGTRWWIVSLYSDADGSVSPPPKSSTPQRP